MTTTHRTLAALILAVGATALVTPTAHAMPADGPLNFSVDEELGKLHTLDPTGKVGQAVTSLAPALLTPLTGVHRDAAGSASD
ncbi:hypothetical protein [Streptomyces inhibens]|uniref:hypothetical protein n=1 Tax=Streptomyces inhibens TaxID=2293571 RepID=UPI001EE6A067|nr:hypothetical protein [Streptomyces inhibens]UKY47482.1 hypothetical protein KI385_00535 [Streptomyces inhibens]